MNENYSRAEILLAVQSSLVGEIFASLCAVDVTWSESELELKYFISGELSESDEECVTSVEAALASHLVGIEIESNVMKEKPSQQSRGAVCVFALKSPS